MGQTNRLLFQTSLPPWIPIAEQWDRHQGHRHQLLLEPWLDA